MKKDLAASVQNVSLKYRRMNNRTRSLKQTALTVARKGAKFTEFNALDGINLEIYRGEILAIVGRNGSGKSTLLKVLSRVIPPTTGRVIVRGHVEPMIELGVGFNPELSGRENIYLNAAIHGRNPALVKERIDEIISWAGLEDVIDSPLRTYSSGMVARLGFSVATDINPDIVLIDEVLSVGDIDFAHKSRERMNKIMNDGATVILVSHDLETIRDLASRVIWLDHGRIREEGKPAKVLKRYVQNA